MRRAAMVGVLLLSSCAGSASVAERATTTAPSAALTAVPAHGEDWATIDEEYLGTGPGVAVLGDSLINGIHDELHEGLVGRSVAIASMLGEGFAGGPWTPKGAEPFMIAQAERYAADDPAVAVIALGTNDAWANPGDARPSLQAVFRAMEGRCTVAVLVATHTTAEGYRAEEAEAINRDLRAEADVVVDWRLRAAPSAVSADGIHLTAEGEIEFAAAIVDAVATCP